MKTPIILLQKSLKRLQTILLMRKSIPISHRNSNRNNMSTIVVKFIKRKYIKEYFLALLRVNLLFYKLLLSKVLPSFFPKNGICFLMKFL